MGVDYIIHYGCVPKERFSSEGLLLRVKAGDRAEAITQFYRQEGQARSPQNMGFEMIRRSADGQQEVEIQRLDELLALHQELAGYEAACLSCPANRTQNPFGCIGNVNYPISILAEAWLLERLPTPEYPLPFLLLQQGPQMGNSGAQVLPLRQHNEGVFFESRDALERDLEEMRVTSDQLFELFFLLGPIPPKRALMILLFMGAIPREMDAQTLMGLTPAPADAAERYPFLLRAENGDDVSIRDMKGFLRALYIGWLLDREVLLDV